MIILFLYETIEITITIQYNSFLFIRGTFDYKRRLTVIVSGDKRTGQYPENSTEYVRREKSQARRQERRKLHWPQTWKRNFRCKQMPFNSWSTSSRVDSLSEPILYITISHNILRYYNNITLIQFSHQKITAKLDRLILSLKSHSVIRRISTVSLVL